MMNLDKDLLENLEEAFSEHPKGILLVDFIKLMKKHIPHKEHEKYDLVHGLCKLFKEIDKFCFFSDGGTAICGRYDIEPRVMGKPRAVSPVSIAVLAVFGNLPEINRRRRGWARHDRPLSRCLNIGCNRVACGLTLIFDCTF